MVGACECLPGAQQFELERHIVKIFAVAVGCTPLLSERLPPFSDFTLSKRNAAMLSVFLLNVTARPNLSALAELDVEVLELPLGGL